jgi:DUF1680 family protein
MHHVKIERQKWFACACCPPNLARIVASLGSYIHSVGEGAVYTHLYIGSEAKLNVSGKEVPLKITTNYPWEGKVAVEFGADASFEYVFRIPGWCARFTARLNGEDATYTVKDGYAYIKRGWKAGDRLEIDFEMPVVLMETNPKVRENAGKAAVMRGPVVYCIEEKDNEKELCKLHIGKPASFDVKFEKGLLEGVTTISLTGKREKDWAAAPLYRPLAEPEYEDKKLTFIPYYAWANRGPGEMTVWVNK